MGGGDGAGAGGGGGGGSFLTTGLGGCTAVDKLNQCEAVRMVHAYLCWSGHVLDGLVKLSFETLAHLGDHMVGSVEGDSVGEDKFHVMDKLIGIVITRIGQIGIRFTGV